MGRAGKHFGSSSCYFGIHKTKSVFIGTVGRRTHTIKNKFCASWPSQITGFPEYLFVAVKRYQIVKSLII